MAHALTCNAFPQCGYIDIGTTTGTEPQERMFDGGHKVADITGEAGRYYDIRVGIKQPPSRDKVSANMFLNAWHNKEKDEVGFGIGCAIEKLYLGNLGAFLGAGGGFGWQEVEGKERVVQNFSSALGYILGASPSKKTRIVHNKNTFVFELHGDIGLVYYITPKIMITGAYEWKTRHYDPYYSVKGSSLEAGVHTGGTEHTFRTGLKIKF